MCRLSRERSQQCDDAGRGIREKGRYLSCVTLHDLLTHTGLRALESASVCATERTPHIAVSCVGLVDLSTEEHPPRALMSTPTLRISGLSRHEACVISLMTSAGLVYRRGLSNFRYEDKPRTAGNRFPRRTLMQPAN